MPAHLSVFFRTDFAVDPTSVLTHRPSAIPGQGLLRLESCSGEIGRPRPVNGAVALRRGTPPLLLSTGTVRLSSQRSALDLSRGHRRNSRQTRARLYHAVRRYSIGGARCSLPTAAAPTVDDLSLVAAEDAHVGIASFYSDVPDRSQKLTAAHRSFPLGRWLA